MKYNAALAAQQDCRHALVTARMERRDPPPELVEAEAKATLLLANIGAELLAVMTKIIAGAVDFEPPVYLSNTSRSERIPVSDRQGPMTIKVTLVIEPPVRDNGDEAAVIAAQLVEQGGQMRSWCSEMSGAPARAVFAFKTEKARDEFLAEALRISGVTVATLQ